MHIPEEGLALRGTFVINPDGVIKTMEVHSNEIARDVAETLRKLKAPSSPPPPWPGVPRQVEGRRQDLTLRWIWSARSNLLIRRSAKPDGPAVPDSRCAMPSGFFIAKFQKNRHRFFKPAKTTTRIFRDSTMLDANSKPNSPPTWSA